MGNTSFIRYNPCYRCDGYYASKVELSYEANKSIPLDNLKYKDYQQFKKLFGEDGNLMVIGIQSDKLFHESFFNEYAILVENIMKVQGVEDALGIPSATNLIKDTSTEKLHAVPVFPDGKLNQQELDSLSAVFLNLPFYRNLLYNSQDNAFLLAIHINKNVMNSEARTFTVGSITDLGDAFGKDQKVAMHYSGLPLIRTSLAVRIANEMRWFLLGSLLSRQ